MADRIKLRRGPKSKIDLNVYELGYVTDTNEQRLYFNNGSMVPIPNEKDVRDIRAELTETTNVSEQNKKDVIELKENVAGIIKTGVAKLVQYSYDIELSETTKRVNIPYEKYSSVTDTLKVYVNGLAIQNDQYTITDPVENEGIVTNGYIVLKVERPAGTIVRMEVWKNVPSGEEGGVNGNIIAQNSLPLDRIIGIGDITTQLNDKANISDVRIYSNLADIGLSDDDMTTDFSSNVLKIIKAMGKNRKIILYPYNQSTNLNLYNSVKTWCGVNTDSYKVIIYSSYNGAENLPNKIEVYPNTNNGENKYLYGFYDNSLGTCKEVQNVEDSGWLDLPLRDGYTSLDGHTCQYRKINGSVKLRGCLKGFPAGNPTSCTFASLPSGFRPSKTYFFMGMDTSTATGFMKYYINADGAMVLKSVSDTTTSDRAYTLNDASFFIN